jgi:hypothetical protein
MATVNYKRATVKVAPTNARKQNIHVGATFTVALSENYLQIFFFTNESPHHDLSFPSILKNYLTICTIMSQKSLRNCFKKLIINLLYPL